jgi:transcriptional regulator with XRE-family HTH domain
MSEIRRVQLDVATAIRDIRANRGLSSADLARRAGISRATLTTLERGAGNPRLETLTAIAGVLGVPLSDFLGDRASAPSTAVLRPDDGVAVTGEAVNVHFLHRFFAGLSLIELYWFEMRGATRQVSPAHTRGLREYVLIFEGDLNAGPAGEEMLAHAGEMLSFEADREHTYASGERTVRATLLMEYPVDQARLGLAAQA